MKRYIVQIFFACCFSVVSVAQAEIKVTHIQGDVVEKSKETDVWKNVAVETVSLMGQPMAIPKPEKTETSAIKVQAIHDGQNIAFRLNWKADKKSEAGKLGEFSDAVAMQFPVKDGPPPPIFMGAKDNPVHIFHWRAQYQKDVEKGKPEMKDLYPHMNADMYPMEFKDQGKVEGLNEEKRETYSPGKASGNPQSYEKPHAVDEIIAEGFGSSSVVENKSSDGHGQWDKGEWTVVITRPLKIEDGSELASGKQGNVGFAVWQGGKQEVGSRKSVTMTWVPVQLEP